MIEQRGELWLVRHKGTNELLDCVVTENGAQGALDAYAGRRGFAPYHPSIVKIGDDGLSLEVGSIVAALA